jgi:hypothetical protein
MHVRMHVPPSGPLAADVEAAVFVDDSPEWGGELLCQAGIETGFVHVHMIGARSGGCNLTISGASVAANARAPRYHGLRCPLTPTTG